LQAVIDVFEDSWSSGIDFGYQGKFENVYTKSFCEFQGAGFADAVSSGSAAIFLAIGALDLPKGSDVIVSPVTDPGSINPVILQGLNAIVSDSVINGFNIGVEEFENSLTKNTRAAIITHLGGHPCDMEPIVEIAKSKGIKIIEDCSQSHGAIYKNERVGNFGDIAVFSTMFSKNHATGGCGGVVFTKSEKYYWRIRSLSDRGKPFDSLNNNPRDPSSNLFPSLNYNIDEISCAIGASTLSKLQGIIDKRLEIYACFKKYLHESSVVSPINSLPETIPSLFFITVIVDVDRLTISKRKFAEAVAAEGVDLNPDYQFVVWEWAWIRKYIRNKYPTQNAIDFKNKTFNILFNERYTHGDVMDIIDSIKKVEFVYIKE